LVARFGSVRFIWSSTNKRMIAKTNNPIMQMGTENGYVHIASIGLFVRPFVAS